MTPTWTEQHSIDLIEAYIGAEIERSPMGFVWIKGDDWKQPIPDLSKDGEWLMRCLQVWLKSKPPLPATVFCTHGQFRASLRYQLEATGISLCEALAWALWEARK